MSVVKQAAEIVNDLRALRAEQCLNCGKAYHNISKTHDWRGWWVFRRPRCEYNPVGWEPFTPQGDTDE